MFFAGLRVVPNATSHIRVIGGHLRIRKNQGRNHISKQYAFPFINSRARNHASKQCASPFINSQAKNHVSKQCASPFVNFQARNRGFTLYIIDYTIFQLSFLYELAVYRFFFKFIYYHSLVCRFVRTLLTKEQVENVLVELGNKQFQKFVKNMDKGDPYAELPKLRYTLMFIQCHPHLSYTYLCQFSIVCVHCLHVYCLYIYHLHIYHLYMYVLQMITQ